MLTPRIQRLFIPGSGLFRGKDTWRDGSTVPVATTRDTYRKDIATPMNAPAWDVMEHKVLRFFSYFNEHVDESIAENYRSRPCEILYYLEVRANI